MAIARLQPKPYTPEEYLALEESADHRSEFYQGEIFAMAGGSFNHDMIAGNVYAGLYQYGTRTGCTAFTSDMKVFVQEHNLYTYPDAMLVCGKPLFQPGRTDTVVNPLLLVEVLSKSTESYDRGKKFDFYRSLPSFEHYILIEQTAIHVEYYQKLADGRWILNILKFPQTVLSLPGLGLELPLQQIYSRVDWFAG